MSIRIKLCSAQQQKPSGVDTGSQCGTALRMSRCCSSSVIGATMLRPVSSAQRVHQGLNAGEWEQFNV
eukprot:s483_g6.t1